jgi:DNA-binding Xre family transcriptional regulator
MEMTLRVRIPELLEARGMTPYALAKASAGRISMSTAYRLRDSEGRLETYAADLLEALSDVLGVPIGELLEREPEPKKGRKG